MIQLLHKISPVDNIALSPSEPQTHNYLFFFNAHQMNKSECEKHTVYGEVKN